MASKKENRMNSMTIATPLQRLWTAILRSSPLILIAQGLIRIPFYPKENHGSLAWSLLAQDQLEPVYR